VDRALRIILGLCLVIYASAAGRRWAVIGWIMVATGLFGYCPLYKPLGFSTLGSKSRRAEQSTEV